MLYFAKDEKIGADTHPALVVDGPANRVTKLLIGGVFLVQVGENVLASKAC